jgi:hypothetical protein
MNAEREKKLRDLYHDIYKLGLNEHEFIMLVNSIIAAGVKEVRADFLWPHEEDSIEEAGYEFANGRTSEYQRQWWEILTERTPSPTEEEKGKLPEEARGLAILALQSARKLNQAINQPKGLNIFSRKRKTICVFIFL